jgi:hypothetical protein
MYQPPVEWHHLLHLHLVESFPTLVESFPTLAFLLHGAHNLVHRRQDTIFNSLVTVTAFLDDFAETVPLQFKNFPIGSKKS